MSDLAIIILNFNTKKLTIECIDSIYKQKTKVNYEIWVLDNDSTEENADDIKKEFPKIHFIKSNKNVGFAAGNNELIKQAKAKYYLVLNSDTVMYPGSLEVLYTEAIEQKLDIAGCLIKYANKKLQPNGGNLPTPLPFFLWISGLDDIFEKVLPINAYHYKRLEEFREKNIKWVAGTAMLVHKDVFEKIGYLDDKIFMYAEDVDFCWRAHNAGFKVGWVENAVITHYGGASSEDPVYTQWRGEFLGIIYLYKKYFGVLPSLLVKLIITFFIVVRMVVFLLLGKANFAKTYGKVLISL